MNRSTRNADIPSAKGHPVPVKPLRGKIPLNRIIPALQLTIFLLGWLLAAKHVNAQLLNMPSHISVTLKASPATLQPGDAGKITVRVTIARGFHIQSHKPLDKNLVPTELTIKKVTGIRFGKVIYPRAISIPASKVITPLGKLAVYEGTVKLRVPFFMLKTAVRGNYMVPIKLQTQACNAISCFIPQEQKWAVTIHVTQAEGFRHATATPTRTPASAGGTGGISPGSGGAAAITAVNDDIAPKTSAASEMAYIQDHPYAPANHMDIPIWALVLFALIGGLILNVMPCVLPVIPIKVMAMVEQAHGSREKALWHALAFTAGVLALFMAIALLLGLQKLAGDKLYFYGEQFQNPFFVVTLVVIVALAGLSMLGVWTVNLPQAVYTAAPASGSYVGSFFTGLLATVLATPCSAPFLGVMITWALGRPIFITILFFGLAGIGMAAPYVVLALFPGFIAKVPRTGRWSELIKQGLGIITIGVAIYLVGTLHDRHQMLIGAFVALAFCLGAWIWGQWPTYEMSMRRVWAIRTAGIIVSVVLAGGAVWLLSGGQPVTSSLATTVQPAQKAIANRVHSSFAVDRWQPFNIYRLQAALEKGHPVLVDFTANWCVNCKFVKATVLDSAVIRRRFHKVAAVLLRADLTTQNPIAQSLLVKLGGRAIPFLAVFSPRSPYHPEILRDIYTIKDVTLALRDVKAR